MKKKLKAVLFDMDGVLFDSMPYHSEAWHKVMKSHGLTLSREEAYMHEGRTGASTINIVFQRELGREATQEEIESIYQEKSVLFNSYPEAKPMPGAWELLQKVKKDGLIPMVVTGSGQLSGHRLRSVIPARTAGTPLSGNVSQRTDGYSVRCKIWQTQSRAVFDGFEKRRDQSG